MNLFPEKVTCSSAGGWDFCEDTIQTITHRGGRQAQDRFSKKKKKSQTLWLPHERGSWLQRLRDGSSTLRVLCWWRQALLTAAGKSHQRVTFMLQPDFPIGASCPIGDLPAPHLWRLLHGGSCHHSPSFLSTPPCRGPELGGPRTTSVPRWFLWAGLGLSLIFSIMEEISFLCGLALGKLSSPLQPQALLWLLFV